jgi:hypothetical protein
MHGECIDGGELHILNLLHARLIITFWLVLGPVVSNLVKMSFFQHEGSEVTGNTEDEGGHYTDYDEFLNFMFLCSTFFLSFFFFFFLENVE